MEMWTSGNRTVKYKRAWDDLRDVASAVSPGVGLFTMGYHYWDFQWGLWLMAGWLIGVLIMEQGLSRTGEKTDGRRTRNGNDRERM